jgi:hypothetical protein
MKMVSSRSRSDVPQAKIAGGSLLELGREEKLKYRGEIAGSLRFVLLSGMNASCDDEVSRNAREKSIKDIWGNMWTYEEFVHKLLIQDGVVLDVVVRGCLSQVEATEVQDKSL